MSNFEDTLTMNSKVFGRLTRSLNRPQVSEGFRIFRGILVVILNLND